jgi:hypothetical protein
MLRRTQTINDIYWCPWAGSNCRPLPYKGSALPLSHMGLLLGNGAGEGNRTLVISLEGFCSTIELHPLGPSRFPAASRLAYSGGGGWIRTNVGVSQQIYSLPPLATRAPLRRERIIMKTTSRDVKLYACVFQFNALTYSRAFFRRSKAQNPR